MSGPMAGPSDVFSVISVDVFEAAMAVASPEFPETILLAAADGAVVTPPSTSVFVLSQDETSNVAHSLPPQTNIASTTESQLESRVVSPCSAVASLGLHPQSLHTSEATVTTAASKILMSQRTFFSHVFDLFAREMEARTELLRDALGMRNWIRFVERGHFRVCGNVDRGDSGKDSVLSHYLIYVNGFLDSYLSNVLETHLLWLLGLYEECYPLYAFPPPIMRLNACGAVEDDTFWVAKPYYRSVCEPDAPTPRPVSSAAPKPPIEPPSPLPSARFPFIFPPPSRCNSTANGVSPTLVAATAPVVSACAHSPFAAGGATIPITTTNGRTARIASFTSEEVVLPVTPKTRRTSTTTRHKAERHARAVKHTAVAALDRRNGDALESSHERRAGQTAATTTTTSSVQQDQQRRRHSVSCAPSPPANSAENEMLRVYCALRLFFLEHIAFTARLEGYHRVPYKFRRSCITEQVRGASRGPQTILGPSSPASPPSGEEINGASGTPRCGGVVISGGGGGGGAAAAGGAALAMPHLQLLLRSSEQQPRFVATPSRREGSTLGCPMRHRRTGARGSLTVSKRSPSGGGSSSFDHQSAADDERLEEEILLPQPHVCALRRVLKLFTPEVDADDLNDSPIPVHVFLPFPDAGWPIVVAAIARHFTYNVHKRTLETAWQLAASTTRQTPQQQASLDENDILNVKQLILDLFAAVREEWLVLTWEFFTSLSTAPAGVATAGDAARRCSTNGVVSQYSDAPASVMNTHTFSSVEKDDDELEPLLLLTTKSNAEPLVAEAMHEAPAQSLMISNASLCSTSVSHTLDINAPISVIKRRLHSATYLSANPGHVVPTFAADAQPHAHHPPKQPRQRRTLYELSRTGSTRTAQSSTAATPAEGVLAPLTGAVLPHQSYCHALAIDYGTSCASVASLVPSQSDVAAATALANGRLAAATQLHKGGYVQQQGRQQKSSNVDYSFSASLAGLVQCADTSIVSLTTSQMQSHTLRHGSHSLIRQQLAEHTLSDLADGSYGGNVGSLTTDAHLDASLRYVSMRDGTSVTSLANMSRMASCIDSVSSRALSPQYFQPNNRSSQTVLQQQRVVATSRHSTSSTAVVGAGGSSGVDSSGQGSSSIPAISAGAGAAASFKGTKESAATAAGRGLHHQRQNSMENAVARDRSPSKGLSTRVMSAINRSLHGIRTLSFTSCTTPMSPRSDMRLLGESELARMGHAAETPGTLATTTESSSVLPLILGNDSTSLALAWIDYAIILTCVDTEKTATAGDSSDGGEMRRQMTRQSKGAEYHSVPSSLVSNNRGSRPDGVARSTTRTNAVRGPFLCSRLTPYGAMRSGKMTTGKLRYYICRSATDRAALLIARMELYARDGLERLEQDEAQMLRSMANTAAHQVECTEHLLAFAEALPGVTMSWQPAPVRFAWAQQQGEKLCLLQRELHYQMLLYVDHLATVGKEWEFIRATEFTQALWHEMQVVKMFAEPSSRLLQGEEQSGATVDAAESAAGPQDSTLLSTTVLCDVAVMTNPATKATEALARVPLVSQLNRANEQQPGSASLRASQCSGETYGTATDCDGACSPTHITANKKSSTTNFRAGDGRRIANNNNRMRIPPRSSSPAVDTPLVVPTPPPPSITARERKGSLSIFSSHPNDETQVASAYCSTKDSKSGRDATAPQRRTRRTSFTCAPQPTDAYTASLANTTAESSVGRSGGGEDTAHLTSSLCESNRSGTGAIALDGSHQGLPLLDTAIAEVPLVGSYNRPTALDGPGLLSPPPSHNPSRTSRPSLLISTSASVTPLASTVPMLPSIIATPVTATSAPTPRQKKQGLSRVACGIAGGSNNSVSRATSVRTSSNKSTATAHHLASSKTLGSSFSIPKSSQTTPQQQQQQQPSYHFVPLTSSPLPSAPITNTTRPPRFFWGFSSLIPRDNSSAAAFSDGLMLTRYIVRELRECGRQHREEMCGTHLEREEENGGDGLVDVTVPPRCCLASPSPPSAITGEEEDRNAASDTANVAAAMGTSSRDSGSLPYPQSRASLRHAQGSQRFYYMEHTYANGDEYCGYWQGNQRNGLGCYTVASSGFTYVGEWERDNPHGDGALLHVCSSSNNKSVGDGAVAIMLNQVRSPLSTSSSGPGTTASATAAVKNNRAAQVNPSPIRASIVTNATGATSIHTQSTEVPMIEADTCVLGQESSAASFVESALPWPRSSSLVNAITQGTCFQQESSMGSRSDALRDDRASGTGTMSTCVGATTQAVPVHQQAAPLLSESTDTVDFAAPCKAGLGIPNEAVRYRKPQTIIAARVRPQVSMRLVFGHWEHAQLQSIHIALVGVPVL